MSYGCGDEDCTDCYGPANFAIVDSDGEVLDRYVDEGTALEMAEEAPDMPPDCYVEAQPDPRFEAKGLNPWAADPDLISPIPDTVLPADERGWARESVWYGNEVGGDDAVTLAYTAGYVKTLDDGREQCVDVHYYVYGKPGDYGVEEATWSFTRTDGEGNDDDDISYEGMAPSFRTLKDALAYARHMALADQRWCFSL